MPNIQEIIPLLHSPSDEDVALITKAYNFAEKAHAPQKRYSGEPYFNHAFATGKILAELGMGPVTIAAGLLHDTLEDAGVSPEILEKEFSKEILFLVDGVTKLGKLRYHGVERHIESLRKLFIAMSRDLRVLIIKLADRLHNMRTLEFVPKEKQERIAAETLRIYAPLSYRLSMRRVNRELENLAFPYVYPKEYEVVKKLLKEHQKTNTERLQKFSRSIKKAFAKEGLIQIKTDERIKSLYSLWKKLSRKNMEIEKIYDVLALRVIVPTISDCYSALGIIHKTWRPLPGRIKDYIAFPKPNGYKGIHTTIFTGDGGFIEVQIRTEDMHREAEFGIASHIGYKHGGRNKKQDGSSPLGLLWLKRYLPFVGKTDAVALKNNSDKNSPADLKTPSVLINVENLDKETPGWVKQISESQEEFLKRNEFVESMETDFFQYRVFVFTPKGDVVDLPIDASPIDFAYAIHTDIGNHTASAKVNGKMTALNTTLKNGDIVEIVTKQSAKPTIKWLDFAKTSFAKKKIREAAETSGHEI